MREIILLLMTLQMAAVTVSTVTNATVEPALAQVEQTIDTTEVATTEPLYFEGYGSDEVSAMEDALGTAIAETGEIPTTWKNVNKEIVADMVKMTILLEPEMFKYKHEPSCPKGGSSLMGRINLGN